MSCETSKKRNDRGMDLYLRELDNMGYGSTSRGQQTVNYAITGDQQARQRVQKKRGETGDGSDEEGYCQESELCGVGRSRKNTSE